MTGDFDVTSPCQPELEEELQKLGFVKPSGPGQMTHGWIHPDLGLGFEVVAATPFEGKIDRAHIALVENFPGGAFAIISVEDLIADRMGQFASGSAPEMGEQTKILFALNIDMDRTYLDRRIRDETLGEYNVEDLKAE
ncbi:MAG: hypothetical protein WA979_05330 [Pacificimonas sp.]